MPGIESSTADIEMIGSSLQSFLIRVDGWSVNPVPRYESMGWKESHCFYADSFPSRGQRGFTEKRSRKSGNNRKRFISSISISSLNITTPPVGEGGGGIPKP